VQDAFSVSSYREYLASRGTIKRILRLVAWFSWIRYESRYYGEFDQVIVLTEQDRHGLCVFSPGLAATVSPAAVSIGAQRTRRLTAENRIVFAGAFSHRPNADAVRFFLDEVFPSIAEKSPNVEFLVAGRDVPRDLLRRQGERIKFLGFVEDMGEFLEQATVVVVPLRFGGGIKIKTLEAMAHGCAIVSTSIGVEEIGPSDEKEILVSDAPHQFAASVLRLLRDGQLREYLGENARNLIVRKFGWEAKARSMEAALGGARRRRVLSSSAAK
jgi:glycosyltransferase involved in cell wall biosynthesis